MLVLILVLQVKQALGLTDTSQGTGTANTAMVCHASRLLALHEGKLLPASRCCHPSFHDGCLNMLLALATVISCIFNTFFVVFFGNAGA
jgi:hypothetical protein